MSRAHRNVAIVAFANKLGPDRLGSVAAWRAAYRRRNVHGGVKVGRSGLEGANRSMRFARGDDEMARQSNGVLEARFKNAARRREFHEDRSARISHLRREGSSEAGYLEAD